MRCYKIILLGCAFAAVTACQRKAEGQTIAVVNNDEITAAELNGELAAANVNPGADKNEVRSRVLTALIDRRLLAQQARSEGIDTSPEFLNRRRKMEEELLISMLASRQAKTATVPTPQEIQAFEASRPEMFANREIWYLDQIQFATPEDAGLLRKINEAKSLEEVENLLKQAGLTYARGKNRIDTAIVPHQMYAQISSLAQGVPFVVPAAGRTVASAIASREPQPLGGAAATGMAVSAIRNEQSAKSMEQRVKELRTKAKIEYKEGFGPR